MPFCKKTNYSSEKKFYNKINKLIKNFLNKIQHKTMNKAVTKLFFLYTLMIFFFQKLTDRFSKQTTMNSYVNEKEDLRNCRNQRTPRNEGNP